MKTISIMRLALVCLVAALASTSIKAQSTDKNYIQTDVPAVPVTQEAAVSILPSTQRSTTIEYRDGLGRSVQTIGKSASPTGADQVSVEQYDSQGRQSTVYLPFAKSGNNGLYLSDPLGDQLSYYQSGSRVAHSPTPFIKTVYENAPQSRIVEQGFAGDAWQPGQNTQELRYKFNLESEQVLMWEMDEATNLPVVASKFDLGPSDQIAFAGFDGQDVGQWQLNVPGTNQGIVGNGLQNTNCFALEANPGAVNTLEIPGLDAYKTYVVRFYGIGAGGVASVNGQTVSLTADWTEHEVVLDNITTLSISGTGASVTRLIDNVTVYELNTLTLLTCNTFGSSGEPGEGDGDGGGSINDQFWVYNQQAPSMITDFNGVVPGDGQYMINLFPGNTVEFTSLDPSKSYSIRFLAYGLPDPSSGGSIQIEVNGEAVTLEHNTWKEYDVTISGQSSVLLEGVGEETRLLDRVCIYHRDIEQFMIPEVYPTAALSVVETTDEHGFKSWEYSNKSGKVVYRKVESNHTVSPLLEQYLVYDDFDRLRANIPPLATEALLAMQLPDVTQLSGDLLTLYMYDGRGRIVEKDLPDAATTWIVYDNLDRPIQVQDGNLRANAEAQFTKYDLLGRPILTGINASGTDRDVVQTNVDYLLGTGSILNHEMPLPGTAGNMYYTSYAWPTNGMDIHTATYYDNYDHDANGSADVSFLPDPQLQIVGQPTDRLRGKMTALFARVLDVGSTYWNENHMFYDNRGRVIQERGSNPYFFSSEDVKWNGYDFRGNMIAEKRQHQIGTADEVSVFRTMTYDSSDRLLEMWQTNNNDAAVLMKQRVYNEIGDLVEVNTHSTDNGNSFLQSTDYTYNIRGWMTHINNCELSDDSMEDLGDGESIVPTKGKGGGGNISGGENVRGVPASSFTNNDSNDLFGLCIAYDEFVTGINAASRFNGSISSVRWKSASDEVQRSYGYAYDALNRMTAANFRAYNDAAQTWSDNVNRYTVSAVLYDANGNLLTMKRNGLGNGAGYGVIDQLQYAYDGNRLLAVTDIAADHGTYDFSDNGASGALDFTYDPNGNMVTDANKNLDIEYNHLGYPTEVDFNNNGRLMRFVYDGAGRKLKREVFENGMPPLYTTYFNDFVYEAGNLMYMSMPEGRVVPDATAGEFRFEHYLMDHLGNVRICYSDLDYNGVADAATEIIQENHFYPFGMELDGLGTPQIGPENPLKFGGKEITTAFDLNWYDFGARQYDAQLGRWMKIDPKAEQFMAWSPYNYALNNPVALIDPDGQAAMLGGSGNNEGGGDKEPKNIGVDPKPVALIPITDKDGNLLGGLFFFDFDYAAGELADGSTGMSNKALFEGFKFETPDSWYVGFEYDSGVIGGSNTISDEKIGVTLALVGQRAAIKWGDICADDYNDLQINVGTGELGGAFKIELTALDRDKDGITEYGGAIRIPGIKAQVEVHSEDPFTGYILSVLLAPMGAPMIVWTQGLLPDDWNLFRLLTNKQDD